MSSETSISVSGVSKCYHVYERPRDRLLQMLTRGRKQFFKEFWALRDISFEIKKGEVIGIVGRNGSGKSTLLQLICGTLNQSAGNVSTVGRVAALLELGSGFNPEFTGRENVFLNGAILGLSRQEIASKMDRILAFAEIGDFIDQPVKTYSSGMYVRLAFAIQANIDPDILIVDEALAVGDAYFTHRCMLRFEQLRERGTTILFVSHDASAVRALCEKCIWLENGRMVAFDTASKVVDRYLAALFGYERADAAAESSEAAMIHRDAVVALPDGIESTIPNVDQRMGDGKYSIIGVGLYDDQMRQLQTVAHGSRVTLRFSIRNDSDESGGRLIAGYIFRTQKGIELASTNSDVEKATITCGGAGSITTVTFAIELPLLHPGSYAFCPAVAYRTDLGDIKMADRLENAVVFMVSSDRQVHAMLNLPTTVSATITERLASSQT
ncbi:ABC transporter ATP-binding protein [Achromobacter xylosoxidans]|uniref:ABC transporter ATP-binding protein n=1 Tax=Alcaligenes xylosoxydans xylosoxydans TaxID=85698 RepID=UPI0008A653FC|nr:ABC transporter ATP-binding protein [Achromobacter xylosoxidans]